MHAPRAAIAQVVLAQAVEQEHARLAQGAVDIAVGLRRAGMIVGAEFGDALVQRLLAGGAAAQVEAPAPQLRLERVQIGIGHQHGVGFRRAGQRRRHRRALAIAVQHHLLAILPGVDEVQHVGGIGLEPADRLAGAGPGPRDQGEARGQVVHARHVQASRQQGRIPEQWEVAEDHVAPGVGHVVRQARAGQGYRLIVREPALRIHHAAMHVRRLLGVVEEQQFAGGGVDLGVGRHTFGGKGAVPARRAILLQRFRVELVQRPALVEGAQRAPGMHYHVGAGGVLQRALRAPALALRTRRHLRQARPQRAPRGFLGEKTLGAHETVAVRGVAVAKADRVQQAVAVEGMVLAQRLVHRVLAVAQVDAVEIARQAAFDLQVRGVPFLRHRRPGAVEVGMRVGRVDGRAHAVDQDCLHGPCLHVQQQKRLAQRRKDAKKPQRTARKILMLFLASLRLCARKLFALKPPARCVPRCRTPQSPCS